nr:hypothetical protein [Mesorhizobium sp. YR577]
MPDPREGLVLNYSYLWLSEHRKGLEEGSKDRPCAVVLTVANDEGRQIVTVLPVTHSPPKHAEDAVEIPTATKRRLGLDDQRSWIVLTEANEFNWPGPDLRPIIRSGSKSFSHGFLPYALYEKVRTGFIEATIKRRAATVNRTE